MTAYSSPFLPPLSCRIPTLFCCAAPTPPVRPRRSLRFLKLPTAFPCRLGLPWRLRLYKHKPQHARRTRIQQYGERRTVPSRWQPVVREAAGVEPQVKVDRACSVFLCDDDLSDRDDDVSDRDTSDRDTPDRVSPRSPRRSSVRSRSSSLLSSSVSSSASSSRKNTLRPRRRQRRAGTRPRRARHRRTHRRTAPQARSTKRTLTTRARS